MGISPALAKQTGTLASTVTVCNAGFLAERDVRDLIPTAALGLVGEIDLQPDTLNIGMSRDRLQRDSRWVKLGADLEVAFVAFVLNELAVGSLRAADSVDSEEVKRTLILWYHYLPEAESFVELREVLERRIFETVPFGVADQKMTTLQNLCSEPKDGNKLFYREIGRRTQRTEHMDDDGLPIRITQEIRDSVRVEALRAKGFSVIEFGHIQVNIHNANAVETQQIPESHPVKTCLGKRGVALINIAEASDADMDLRSIERLPVLRDALAVDGGLRFAEVGDSRRRVVTDSAGIKYLNLKNPDVRRVLAAVPAAIGNPLRRRLLDAYLKLEEYQFAAVRAVLVELLAAEDLEALASGTNAPFTERYVDALVKDLLKDFEQ